MSLGEIVIIYVKEVLGSLLWFRNPQGQISEYGKE
jgi:hypothetical protein